MPTNKAKYIVLGYGVSTIAIVKHLQDSGEDFIIISAERFKIWKRARDLNLNFDLVSSHENSFIAGGHKYRDYDNSFPFLSATEYGDYLEWLCTSSGHDKLIRECMVTAIHETASGVKLETTDGMYECEHLIYDADLTPKFDVASILKKSESLRGKTVLLDGFGDTANMLVSKLVLGDNKVIVRSAGMYTLDKMFRNHAVKRDQLLDQAEPHWLMWNLRGWWAFLDAPHTPYFQQKWGHWRGTFGKLVQSLVNVPHFFIRNTANLRPYKNHKPGYMSDANGNPAKYWPIDVYFGLWEGGWQQHMLEHNVLLNDPWFFEHIGALQIANKAEETGDKCCYKIDGKETHVDEAFFFPPVQTRTLPMTSEGQEVCVDMDSLYKGMLHPKFKRVFFCGTLRPAVGGFGLFGEMYKLFFKYVFQSPAKMEQYLSTLPAMIADYQRKHGGAHKISNSKWAGYMVQGVMQEIGMRFTWNRSKSFGTNLRNLTNYVIGPTSVLKMDLMDHGYEDDEVAQVYNNGVRRNMLVAEAPAIILPMITMAYNQFMVLALFTLGRYYTTGALPLANLAYFLVMDRFMRNNLELTTLFVLSKAVRLVFGYMAYTTYFGATPHLGYFMAAQATYLVTMSFLGRGLSFFNKKIDFDSYAAKYAAYRQVHKESKVKVQMQTPGGVGQDITHAVLPTPATKSVVGGK